MKNINSKLQIKRFFKPNKTIQPFRHAELVSASPEEIVE
jgi:hypothetical protein